MTPSLPPGSAWRFGARQASFIVFVVVLLGGAIVATTRPSIASGSTAKRTMRSAPVKPRPAARERPTASPSPVASASPATKSPSPVQSQAPRDELARLAAFGRPIYCGAGRKPLVALTFDDGPGVLTPLALKPLHRFHAKATFFLVGKLLEEPSLRAIAAREAAAGMAFGDHTWDHVIMTGRSTSFYEQQIGRTAAVVKRATGQRPRLFRPPFEAHDHSLDRWLRQQGVLEILWSTDSRDSQGATTARVYQTVRRGIRPGAIILLHDNRGTTETALTEILHQIRVRGLKAVTVPELLMRDPPTAEQLRSHTCG